MISCNSSGARMIGLPFILLALDAFGGQLGEIARAGPIRAARRNPQLAANLRYPAHAHSVLDSAREIISRSSSGGRTTGLPFILLDLNALAAAPRWNLQLVANLLYRSHAHSVSDSARAIISCSSSGVRTMGSPFVLLDLDALAPRRGGICNSRQVSNTQRMPEA